MIKFFRISQQLRTFSYIIPAFIKISLAIMFIVSSHSVFQHLFYFVYFHEIPYILQIDAPIAFYLFLFLTLNRKSNYMIVDNKKVITGFHWLH